MSTKSYLRKRLDSLPMGNRPWSAYNIRSNYLDKLFDRNGITDEDERRQLKEQYIGYEPPDIDSSDSVGGWWDRTVTGMGYQTAITFNQLR